MHAGVLRARRKISYPEMLCTLGHEPSSVSERVVHAGDSRNARNRLMRRTPSFEQRQGERASNMSALTWNVCVNTTDRISTNTGTSTSTSTGTCTKTNISTSTNTNT